MSDDITVLREELSQLRADLAALSARADKADHYVEICNLQCAYGYYVDKGRWDDAANLFAEDGTLELAGRGVYVGRERVREYLHHLPPYGHGTIYNHMQLQPVVHIDCVAGYDEGWHKGGVQLLRSIDGLQPDLPPTMEYESYPEPVIAPYHYKEV